MVLKLQVSDASGTHAQDIILTSSYQKFSAVFGRMFVFYWVTDIGMRLLAAALADSQISSKKLHDHWKAKNSLQKMCTMTTILVGLLAIVGLGLYCTMVTAKAILDLDPVARQAVTILSWTLGCLGQIFSLMGSCMEPSSRTA
jgi:hypothetical protein